MFALLLMSAAAPAAAERSIAVMPFQAIDLAMNATMRVEQAPVAGVVAIGDPRVVRCVSTSVHDGRLTIGWAGKGRTSKQLSAADDDIIVTARADCRARSSVQRLMIRVAAPMVVAVTIREQGIVCVLPMHGQAFTANIPGRGSIRIDGLRASMTRLSIAGSGRIDATGELGRLAISVPGSGTIDTRAAHADAMDVMMAGRGSVAATVDGPATGALGGSGTIAVGGHPNCAIRNPGGGSIICPAAANKGVGA